jgi:ribose transport system ATP-binding protein
VVAQNNSSAFNRDSLVTAMGGREHAAAAEAVRSVERQRGEERVRARPARQADATELVAHAGEIIGLAGLAGHGQTQLLLGVFEAAHRHTGRVKVNGPVALVAGDRQADGIFPLWSIAQNLGVRSIGALQTGFLISPEKERDLADNWRTKINIRTPDLDNGILSLSGGNQQKVLFARALASDAVIILMDDPMRGVDIATKLEVYDLIREEARKGRTFLWYTTEMDELTNCDHVYIFRNGQIVADLPRDRLSEESVIQSSFDAAVAP